MAHFLCHLGAHILEPFCSISILPKTFIGLNDEYVEGIFVSGEMQSQGIGKILLNYAKDKRNKLHLNVYQKNARAISFYKREGFEIQHSGLDEATGEKDYVMTWQHK